MTVHARWLAAALLVAACGSGEGAEPAPPDPPPVSSEPGEGPVALVNPFVGTATVSTPGAVANGKSGATFPGAALPFGMVQWSPDTPNAAPQGYLYSDSVINGFSVNHLNGAGCQGERDFPIFATLGLPDVSQDPADGFSHARERASPGFYSVELGSGIAVALTATTRTGYARFTFPGAGGHLSITSGFANDRLFTEAFEAELVNGQLVTGSRVTRGFCLAAAKYRIYFAARLSRPITSSATWDDGELSPGARRVDSPRGGLSLGFDTAERRVVELKLGLSYTSAEAALANLDAEAPDWDFDATHRRAIDAWNRELGRVEVEGGSDADRRAFYTALYHALLQPKTFNDVDGAFPGFDGVSRVADGYTRYANFSGWDIYRSWIHLVSALSPSRASDMVRSLVESGEECGALPRWPLANGETGAMVGDPADPIIAGAWAFGARGFDAARALALMQRGANDVGAACNGVPARPGLAAYLDRHYLPSDAPKMPHGPASTTLEYALSDFSIGKFAEAVGDAATAAAYLERGRYWRNVLDEAHEARGFRGYVMPRLTSDAGGAPAFAPVDVSDRSAFVEGNSAQYTFFAPHDVPGIIAGVGGEPAFIARLDDLFSELNAGVSRPHFYMGNEPQFGTPWEYPWAGAPWRTQAVVREIVSEVFSDAPDGLPGNDDLGATSAWLVWAMLGLYPEVPGVGGLVVGSPLFPRVTLHLENGKELIIVGEGAARDAPYVESLTLDGVPVTRAWLDWSALANGGELVFTLGRAPNPAWASGASERPPAMYP